MILLYGKGIREKNLPGEEYIWIAGEGGGLPEGTFRVQKDCRCIRV